MSDSDYIIRYSNVTKRFGKLKAVNGASFSVGKGEVVGFVGPNGAGKTTAISMMMGFLNPSEGTVELFGGERVTPGLSHLTHRRIGFCASDMGMFDNLTGQQYLDYQAGRFGVDKAIQKQLIDSLKPQLGAKISKLSRGNRQKIALTAALQHGPELIVLDEPTSGLDPLVQETFLDIIKDLSEKGATVFMSSHILSEVAKVCTRILFMKAGKIVTDEPIGTIEAKAGKLLHITVGPDGQDLMVNNLPPGAKVSSRTETTVSLQYDGAMPPVIRWLAGKRFTDITIEDRQLDDIFHELYRDEEAKS